MITSDSRAYSFLTRLTDLWVGAVLWILSSLPIVTIGPASAALLVLAIDRHRGDSSTGAARTFLRALKRHLRQGTLWTLLWLLGNAILIAGVTRLLVDGNPAALTVIGGLVIVLVLYNTLALQVLAQIAVASPNPVMDAIRTVTLWPGRSLAALPAYVLAGLILVSLPGELMVIGGLSVLAVTAHIHAAIITSIPKSALAARGTKEAHRNERRRRHGQPKNQITHRLGGARLGGNRLWTERR